MDKKVMEDAQCLVLRNPLDSDIHNTKSIKIM
jgi:hypothetical protein